MDQPHLEEIAVEDPRGCADRRSMAEYFWNSYLDGEYDDEYDHSGISVVVFDVTEDDRHEYPVLGDVRRVHAWEDAQWFVHHSFEHRID